MGSCVSIHRESNSDMKIRRSFSSKVRTFFHPSSAAKNRVSNGENHVKTIGFDDIENKNFGFVLPAKSASTKDLFGSKDEIFFDSRAWLDSDCEDDFLSVNGDFTPSGCTTPNHQSSVPGTPIPKDLLVEMASDHNPETSETSPTDKKKKLADFLKDSFRKGEEDGVPNEQSGPTIENNNMVVAKSREETPGSSGRNSSNEKTPNRELKLEKERKLKVGQCCIPGLVTSFNDRKKHIENNNMVVAKSREETPGSSGRNSSNEKTPNRELKLEKERKLKVGQCCIPGLVTSFNDRKKHQNGG